MYYRNERNGLLLPFLAGFLVGPLFFNGYNHNQQPYQPISQQPYQPIYQQPYPSGYQPFPVYQQYGPVFYQP